MPTVNAVVWKNLLLNPVFGLFSWITSSLGLGRPDVLATAPKLGIMAMAVWQWTPFMMLILLAGLQGLSDEVREAAHMDGATGLDEFRFITLPLLGRYIELAVLLGTIYVLQLFGEIFVATQGGPGTATTTVPYYVYQTIAQSNDVGSSSAQGVLAVLVASVHGGLPAAPAGADIQQERTMIAAPDTRLPRAPAGGARRFSLPSAGLTALTYLRRLRCSSSRSCGWC